MRFTIDTNILVYAEIKESGPKHRAALDIMRRAPAAIAPSPYRRLASCSAP